MTSITTWAKENYDLISLLVGVIGVVIGIISLMYEIRKKKAAKQYKKEEIQKEIDLKQAELDALKSGNVIQTPETISQRFHREAVLKNEIETLRKKL